MNHSIRWAVIAVIGLLLWMLSGRFVDSVAVDPQPNNVEETRMSVAVRTSIAQTIDRTIVAQGQLEAYRKVELRAETAGRVQIILAERGQLLRTGQRILKLLEKDRVIKIDKAEAEIASKALKLEAISRLVEKGLQSETNLKQARADLAAAQAEKKRLQLDLEDTAIQAPFKGILEQRFVEKGSYLEIGDQIAEIVDIHKLKPVAYIGQQDIQWVKPGQRVSVRLLDGREAQAVVRYIAKSADPDTRSFRIEAEFDNPDLSIQAGLSAELSFRVGSRQAHLISPALLVLDTDGQVGVKAVDKEQQVVFYPVQLGEADQNGIWVSGLPAQITVITRGQGFVMTGEQVTPLPMDSE